MRHHYAHVISISNVDVAPPPGFEALPARKLALQFYDLRDSGPPEYRPKPEHVEQILRFAAPISAGERVLVHCNAGISRSSAAALAILAARRSPSEAAAVEAVQTLVEIKSGIYPNTPMVRFADQQLGYGGALLAQVEAVFTDSGGHEILW